MPQSAYLSHIDLSPLQMSRVRSRGAAVGVGVGFLSTLEVIADQFSSSNVDG